MNNHVTKYEYGEEFMDKLYIILLGKTSPLILAIAIAEQPFTFFTIWLDNKGKYSVFQVVYFCPYQYLILLCHTDYNRLIILFQPQPGTTTMLPLKLSMGRIPYT